MTAEIKHAAGASDGFFTYWLKIFTDEEGLLWEGPVDGKVGEHAEQPKLDIRTIPDGLRKVLNENQIVKAEWQPAWDEIPQKRLEAGD